MRTALRTSVVSVLAVAGCLLLVQPSNAAEGIPGNLVDVRWLERNLARADLRLLDASPTQLYAANHIPGAVSVDLYSYGVKERPVAETQELFQSWGVSPGETIVLYDQGGSMLATWLFFALESHGFPAQNLLVLDGGLAKWQEAGLPVTKEATPAPTRGSFQIQEPAEEVKAELPEFLTASGDTAGNALVEALGADWHFGEVLNFDRAGHIPHAILLPSADFYQPDKTFKSPQEIQRMVTYLGIRPEQAIYSHCGGGVAATVPYFALKFLLDYPRVKVYSGSQLDWLNDERELPYWTYDAPFLMRDSKWLQWKGSQRIRTYLGAQVSILDLRPADAFEQGHLPFALNIPAESFRTYLGDLSQLSQPDRLAEILGAAGVDATHEAVIVSGAGLTRDSALAFAMLEKLGQTKVSVFMDSMERWTELGFPVTKDPTVVGPRKHSRDLSIPPTAYPGTLRTDVIVADAKSTHGVYPKVFIASGENVPAKAQDGKVIHVPYTDLLNADGRPKAAKEIWKILDKAGVPRYAEIVCFADDPGDAAANYYILKLMGYPDIKVAVI